jgi:hypothetical protein
VTIVKYVKQGSSVKREQHQDIQLMINPQLSKAINAHPVTIVLLVLLNPCFVWKGLIDTLLEEKLLKIALFVLREPTAQIKHRASV